MKNYADYFVWLADGGWIRVSARAVILNRAEDHILIERNYGVQNEYANFIGGGVEVGETLLECIQRELAEETNARITQTKYLFVLENFFTHEYETRHSLEHYFEIELEREDITPKSEGVEFLWVPINQLGDVDLRPMVVRNRIMDGTFRHVDHLILPEWDA